MNDSMSLGIHRLWKDSFVTSLLPRLPPSRHTHPVDGVSTSTPFKCLDVAGGTGDIALRILDRAREKFGNREIEVEIVDLNEGMLDEGRKRVAKTLYYNSEPNSHLALCSKIPANMAISSPDTVHAWKCSSAAIAHRGQLDRPLHHCFRYQELYIAPGCPLRGVQGSQARRQAWCIGVWQSPESTVPRVSKVRAKVTSVRC